MCVQLCAAVRGWVLCGDLNNKAGVILAFKDY